MPAVPALRAPEAGGRLVRCSAHRGGARHPHARHAQGGRFRARVRRWALRGSGGRQLAERGRGTSSADLDAAQAADARWLRVDINWTQIQADGPAAYDCDHVDALITAPARGGCRSSAPSSTPPFGRGPGTEATFAPHPATFASFAAAAAQHLAVLAVLAVLGVHAYEIWNEPNAVSFWTPAPDPAL